MKDILLGLALVVVIGLLGFVAFKPVSAFGSAAGSTFNSAKVATVVMSPSVPGAAATSSSLLNSDSSDRKIENFFVDCSGVGTSKTAYTGTGLAAFVVSAATTSTANPVGLGGNTNKMDLTVATATPDSYNVIGNATTSPNALTRVWTAGSYLTIQFNATNTASCVAGVNYAAS